MCAEDKTRVVYPSRSHPHQTSYTATQLYATRCKHAKIAGDWRAGAGPATADSFSDSNLPCMGRVFSPLMVVYGDLLRCPRNLA